jgi:hypothetical protein
MLSLADDPEDAVTAGSSIIKSVCRSILIKLGVPLPDKKDIDGLMRAVQAPLGLSPGQRNIPLKVERDVRHLFLFETWELREKRGLPDQGDPG